MEYQFLETVSIWWHGHLQRVKYDLPYIKPEREGNKAPAWFRDVYPAWYWDYYLDDDDRPTHIWLKNYFHAADRLFKTWLDRLKSTAISDAFAAAIGLTGRPKAGYYTIEDWITAFETWVYGPLYDWISDIIVDVYNLPGTLKAWARTRYDAAIAQIPAIQDWLNTTGATLRAFYNDTHTWIANFKGNPAGVILGVLGSTWARVVTFDQGALGYFYSLWGSYRQTLADFLADPLGWIYDQAESFLVRKW